MQQDLYLCFIERHSTKHLDMDGKDLKAYQENILGPTGCVTCAVRIDGETEK